MLYICTNILLTLIFFFNRDLDNVLFYSHILYIYICLYDLTGRNIFCIFKRIFHIVALHINKSGLSATPDYAHSKHIYANEFRLDPTTDLCRSFCSAHGMMSKRERIEVGILCNLRRFDVSENDTFSDAFEFLVALFLGPLTGNFIKGLNWTSR